MANGCTLFGGLVPNVYIDRVFLEESLVDTDPDPTVYDVLQTPKITVSLKLIDQLDADGTYSLLNDALVPTDSLNLKQYLDVRCVVLTSTEKAGEFEEMFYNAADSDRIAKLNKQIEVHHIQTGTTNDPNIYANSHTLEDFTCTYTNSGGNIEILANYPFELHPENPLEHLTIFAYVQLNTTALAADFSLDLPSSLQGIISTAAQEIVIQNSQVVSLLRGYSVQGTTSTEQMRYAIAPPSEDHVHAYSDIDANGDGWTEYAVHPAEPLIKHRHQVINGIVQSAHSDCWKIPITAAITAGGMQDAVTDDAAADVGIAEGVTSQIEYTAGSCEDLYGLEGVGPHGHLLETTYVSISNVQDFRIRDELDILAAEFTSLATEQRSLPWQKEVFAQLTANSSYFSEIFITKDANRNARFLFAFDHGKYVLERSKYANIISKMSDSAKQILIGQSGITRFILSRRQVEKAPRLNRRGSPVHNFPLRGTIEEPIILSEQDSNLTEIALITSTTSLADSWIRYFTGIDSRMSTKSNGLYQYIINVELIDGFVPYMNAIYSGLSNAAAEYQKYIALTQIPDVYDVESRKFTAYGQGVLSDMRNSLTAIINTYLDTLGAFIDLTGTNADGQSRRNSYGAKIYDFTNPFWGGIEGVLLFDNLIALLLTQINNIMKVGHSGGGVDDTIANQPSNRESAFKLQTVEQREEFVNTVGARFRRESYIDNIGATPQSQTRGLNLYTTGDLSFAVSTVYTGEPAGSELNSFWQTLEEGTSMETLSDSDGQSCALEDQTGGTESTAPYLGANSAGLRANMGPDSPRLPPDQPGGDPDIRIPRLDFDRITSPADPVTPEEEPYELTFDVLVRFGLSPTTQHPFAPVQHIQLHEPIFESRLISQLTDPEAEATTGLPTTTEPANRFYLCRQPQEALIDLSAAVSESEQSTSDAADPWFVSDKVELHEGVSPVHYTYSGGFIPDGVTPVEVVDSYFLVLPGTSPPVSPEQEFGVFNVADMSPFIFADSTSAEGGGTGGSAANATTAAQRAAAKYGESPEGAAPVTATGVATTTTTTPGLPNGASTDPSSGAPPPSQAQARRGRRGRLLTRGTSSPAMPRKRRGGY